MPDIYRYTWEYFDADVKRLLTHLPVKPDLVVGIAAGGLPLMIRLSAELEIPYEIIKCHSYEGTIRRHIAVDSIPNWFLLDRKRILLIDDMCDSGHTLVYLKTLLLDQMMATSVETCVLCHKEHAIIQPNSYARVVEDNSWVMFPWEKQTIN